MRSGNRKDAELREALSRRANHTIVTRSFRLEPHVDQGQIPLDQDLEISYRRDLIVFQPVSWGRIRGMSRLVRSGQSHAQDGSFRQGARCLNDH